MMIKNKYLGNQKKILAALLLSLSVIYSVSSHSMEITVTGELRWVPGLLPFSFYPDYPSACIAELQRSQGSSLIDARPAGCPSPQNSACDCFFDYSDGIGNIITDAFRQNAVIRQTICPAGTTPSGFGPDGGLPGNCSGVLAENQGPRCPEVGNPINPLTGNKYQREQDFPTINGLELIRHYNSYSTLNLGFGIGWASNLIGKRLLFGESNIVVIDANGHMEPWTEVNGEWISDPDSQIRLLYTATGYEVIREDNSREMFDSAGRLTATSDITGNTLTYAYDADNGRLTSVTNHFDEKIEIVGYNLTGEVTTIRLPGGELIRYEYESGRLLRVIYPDVTLDEQSDNPVRVYHYETGNLLTGITDENGVRFATWAYDAQGRAISSEHAGGVEKVTVDYTHIDDINSRVTVTNALGKQTTYHFETIHGQRLTTLIEGHASLNCPDTDRSNTYDANGFRDLAVDWNGVLTDFDHDERGLEIQRIEAVGTSEQRTITTTWHPNFRLPTEIVEPNKTTTFTYDTNGNLLSRTETDTGATP